mmetsp:Transcript_6767/g.21846  ORF Transcript_6767/g.21846 Transcript_6767/m.21846 type:complete len:215 (-) Transcript_6767:719-1363(-)
MRIFIAPSSHRSPSAVVEDSVAAAAAEEEDLVVAADTTEAVAVAFTHSLACKKHARRFVVVSTVLAAAAVGCTFLPEWCLPRRRHSLRCTLAPCIDLGRRFRQPVRRSLSSPARGSPSCCRLPRLSLRRPCYLRPRCTPAPCTQTHSGRRTGWGRHRTRQNFRTWQDPLAPSPSCSAVRRCPRTRKRTSRRPNPSRRLPRRFRRRRRRRPRTSG